MVCENIFMAPPRPMARNGALSHKMDYIPILNLEEHQNRITGSRDTAILING